MTTQEKLALIGSAYIVKEVEDDREKIIVLNDTLPAEFHAAMRDIQFRLNEITRTFEHDYGIMQDACYTIANMSLEDIEDEDKFDEAIRNDTYASMYTYARLSYLTPTNQDEISDKVRECGCDIAEACAYWYDEQVVEAAAMIRSYLIEK